MSSFINIISISFKCFQVLNEATDGVTCMQVSDYEILTGSADGRIRRYDLRNGKLSTDMIGSK